MTTFGVPDPCEQRAFAEDAGRTARWRSPRDAEQLERDVAAEAVARAIDLRRIRRGRSARRPSATPTTNADVRRRVARALGLDVRRRQDRDRPSSTPPEPQLVEHGSLVVAPARRRSAYPSRSACLRRSSRPARAGADSSSRIQCPPAISLARRTSARWMATRAAFADGLPSACATSSWLMPHSQRATMARWSSGFNRSSAAS